MLMRAARSTDATRFLKILAACTPEHDVPGDNKNLFIYFFSSLCKTDTVKLRADARKD